VVLLRGTNDTSREFGPPLSILSVADLSCKADDESYAESGCTCSKTEYRRRSGVRESRSGICGK
jgi:hypothetical protein